MECVGSAAHHRTIYDRFFAHQPPHRIMRASEQRAVAVCACDDMAVGIIGYDFCLTQCVRCADQTSAVVVRKGRGRAANPHRKDAAGSDIMFALSH